MQVSINVFILIPSEWDDLIYYYKQNFHEATEHIAVGCVVLCIQFHHHLITLHVLELWCVILAHCLPVEIKFN